jgi:serine protease Do
MPGNGGGGGRPEQIQQGVGSGFIVSADGYVLTNAHVVDGASEVTVKLTDKRDFKAKVVGVDKRTDVALLKIDAAGLPFVRTGDAERSKVGEWVVAMGSPFGFENTVTAGIISAKARRLPDENYVPFIQTDVAINPGNSGGPLFNLAGEVIGINSQIYSRSGGFMGISFAIPIDVAMKVKDQLQKYGKVSRGRLGVAIQGLDAELAQNFGLDKPVGALVASVENGSPPKRPASRRATWCWASMARRWTTPPTCRASSASRSPARWSACRSGATARPATSTSPSASRPARSSPRWAAPSARARAPAASWASPAAP